MTDHYHFGEPPHGQWISVTQLRCARLVLGLTTHEAGFKTGTSKGTLIRLENGTGISATSAFEIIDTYQKMGVTFFRRAGHEGIEYIIPEPPD